MASPLQLQHIADPKHQIIRNVRPWVEDMEIKPYSVLVAVYLRGKMLGDKITKSGIWLADNGQGTLREDEYQGKVGLVMKLGSLAYKEDPPNNLWGGFAPQVGDWVVYNVGDTFMFELPDGWRCRLISENHIQAIVQAPDTVW